MPTYVASNGANALFTSSWSVSRPTGTAAGHVLIAFVASSGTTIGTPTGGTTWQALDTVSGFGLNSRLYWKVAGASEPSSYGFTQSGSEVGAAIVVAVSEASQEEPQSDTSTSGSGTSVATPSMTPLAVGDLDLRFGAAYNFAAVAPTWSPPANYTEREEVDANLLSASLATRTLTSTSATGTINFTISSSADERLGAAVLVTSPPAGGGTRVVIPRTAVHRAASW